MSWCKLEWQKVFRDRLTHPPFRATNFPGSRQTVDDLRCSFCIERAFKRTSLVKVFFEYSQHAEIWWSHPDWTWYGVGLPLIVDWDMRIQTRNSQYFEQAGHLEPPEEEGKLDGEEERVEQVQLCLGIAHREAVRLLRKKSIWFEFKDLKDLIEVRSCKVRPC